MPIVFMTLRIPFTAIRVTVSLNRRASPPSNSSIGILCSRAASRSDPSGNAESIITGTPKASANSLVRGSSKHPRICGRLLRWIAAV